MLLCTFLAKAQYTPITVTGFNHDIVADGAGNSSLATTTKEMDALTPSNFVLCTNQFATANSLGVSGLPNTLSFASGTSTYQMVNTPGLVNNALYLLTSEVGTLTLGTPASYSSISLLTTGTEGGSTISVLFTFTDGTTSTSTQTVNDWWGTTAGNINTSSGRIKRVNNITSTDKEVDGTKAYFFTLNMSLPCGKILSSIRITNTGGTTVTGSKRVFILAVSGVAAAAVVTPVPNTPVICGSGSASLTVTNPQSGLNYRWYTAATGGIPLTTAISYTTPVLTTNTTYYIETVVLPAGCIISPRVPAVVTVSSAPAAPAAPAVTICPGTAATIAVQSPVTGTTYNLYTAATGGTAVATSTTGTLTTPVVSAATTYYLEAVSAGGCSSTRTPVAVSLFTPLASPVVTATSIGTTSITFSWAAVPGANGYEVSVNGGSSYTAPSSGTTGLTHTVTGLAVGQTVNIIVRTIAANTCQVSSGTQSATTITDQVYVPNAFTPNNDGRNDILFVYSNVIQSMRLQVFNQWGEKIFESTNRLNGWNGEAKGKQQPSGVYVYTLHVVTTTGQVIDRKGAITLVR